MTTTQIHKLITSLEHRKRLSATIGNIESRIIAFLEARNCQGKPVVIGSWEVFFDGRELSINKAPVDNSEQMNLFGEKQYERKNTESLTKHRGLL